MNLSKNNINSSFMVKNKINDEAMNLKLKYEKEILDLKKELYDEQLKNYENQDSNKINLFPGIIRKPERKKSKSI